MEQKYNKLCSSCKNPCKQAPFVTVIECPHYDFTGGKLPAADSLTSEYRELTDNEKQEMKKLITSLCANYDNTYKECLLLDSVCPMLQKHYHNGKLCKYFASAVLPTSPKLEASLLEKTTINKICPVCGSGFYSETSKKYCGESCTQKAKKEADRIRTKKYRKNKG